MEQEAQLLEEIEGSLSYMQQGEDLQSLKTALPKTSLVVDRLLEMKLAKDVNTIHSLGCDAHAMAENSFTFLDHNTIDALHFLINQSELMETQNLKNKELLLAEPINYRAH